MHVGRLNLTVAAAVCGVMVLGVGWGPVQRTQAALIDFEGLALSEGDAVSGIPNATFVDAVYVVAGEPAAGFGGNTSGITAPCDTSANALCIDDAGSGNSITSAVIDGTVVVTFDFAVMDLMFDAVDIEVGIGVTETFTASVFDSPAGGTLLHTIVFTPSGPIGTGDGDLTPIDFSTGFTGTDAIRRLEFSSLSGAGPTQTIPGFAVDNLSFAAAAVAIGEPASLWLLALGLIGLGAIAHRRRSAVHG